jgi:hypothetical protein
MAVHPSQLRIEYTGQTCNPGCEGTCCMPFEGPLESAERIVRRPCGLPAGTVVARSAGAEDAQSCASSAVISLTADLASPNNIAVFGSKYSSFSIPAKPGFIERLITITEWESATSRIGIP